MDQLSQANNSPLKYTLGVIMTSFAFVVGLAWNDFIRLYFQNNFPVSGSETTAALWYALIITAALIIFAIAISYFFFKKSDKDKEIEINKQTCMCAN